MFGDITFPVYLVFLLGTWALFAVLTVAGILAAPVAFIIGTISLPKPSSRNRCEEGWTSLGLSLGSFSTVVYYTTIKWEWYDLADITRTLNLGLFWLWRAINMGVLLFTTTVVAWFFVEGIFGYIFDNNQDFGVATFWYGLDMLVCGLLCIAALRLYTRLAHHQLDELRFPVYDSGSGLNSVVFRHFGVPSIILALASALVGTLCGAVYFIGLILIPVALSV